MRRNARVAGYAILVALLSACASAYRNPWIEPDRSQLPDHDVLIAPGRYLLLLLATRGSKKDATASGVLTLRPALDTDRSPHTGESPSRLLAPALKPSLWGFTDLDFSRVGALLETGQHDNGLAIAPSIDDPIYPGVLGYVQERNGHKLQTLRIGTYSSRRGNLVIDGLGVGLSINRVQGGSLFGVWYPMGYAGNGAGTWQLTRIR